MRARICACKCGFRALLYSLVTYAPHQEGWRDWPDETPATPSDLGPRKVPTPAGVVEQVPGRCGKRAPHGTSAHIRPGGGFFVEEPMAVESLKCKECGESYPLEARFVCEQCFGPLEVAYDFSDLDPAEARRKIQAGSRGIWRYSDFLPFEGRPGDPLEPGLTPADPRRPARRAARPGRALDQERRGQPDALLQGPRRRGRGRQGQGARLRDRRLRVDREPRERRRRPRGRRRPRLLRLRARRPRGAEAARHRHLRHQPGRHPRHLRRRQPALYGAQPDPPVGVRQRQPAPVLLRGLEDARVRDDRAARLEPARPRRRADRLGLDVHQARQGHARLARAGTGRGRAADLLRRPGARAARRWRPPSPRAGTSASPSAARHDRQEPRDRRSGRRPLRARAGAAAPAA